MSVKEKRTPPTTILLLWKAGGFSAMGLGFIGIPLPLFPTVPFLLLAIYCFSKGSPQMFRRIMENKYLGPPLRDYREQRGVRLPVKLFSISFLWVSVLSSVIFFVGVWWVRLLLICIAAAVTIHITSLKTLRQKD